MARIMLKSNNFSIHWYRRALLGLMALGLVACGGGGGGGVVLDESDDETVGDEVSSYSVTPSAGEGGSISPATAQTVNHGATTSFTLTPAENYSIDTVSGCDGSLEGNTYTTGEITADCSVQASFSLNSYTVTPNAGTGGSISPATAQTVNHGATTSFTITPDIGYSIDAVGGTCGGSLSGSTYTSNAITANCTVQASFTLPAPQDLAATTGNKEVSLSWTGVTGATDYCVYVSENAGIHPDTATSYDGDLSGCLGNTGISHTVTGLTNDTEYHFIVTASDGSVESEASNEATATPEVPAITASRPLNDTGIDWCADGTTNNHGCPQSGYLGQDGDHGRDADGSLVKVGGGHAGLDFTKLDASGNPLGDQGAHYALTPWACVQDNHTGLMWEVKVNDSSSMHHMGHTYTWYNGSESTNGGDVGAVGSVTCGSGLIDCNTESFVENVNLLSRFVDGAFVHGLCGHSDWRLPTRKELISLLNSSISSPGPTIDSSYFPNTEANLFWSSSSDASLGSRAWAMSFSDGGSVSAANKDIPFHVRLVRTGQ